MKKNNLKKTIQLPKPLPYQLDILKWLDDPEVKFVSFKKARQSGGSYLNKMLVVKWGLESNLNKIGYIVPTNKLGKLFYRELCNSLGPLIADSNSTDLLITFKSGSNVQFFSAESGDSIRGFQFTHTIIDEAAFMNENVFNLIIRPTFLIAGKKVILCSTPNGNKGFFYDYCQYGLNNEKGYKTKMISIYDNPFIDKEEIELIKRQVPDLVFRQEYLGEFLDGSGTVFSNFRKCINDKPVKNGVYYAAIDWAKSNDYTVLTIMNSLKQVVYIWRITGMEYTQQVKIISAKLNEWKPKITISEENNIGSVINELLKEQYKGFIRTVTLDNSFKKDMIENLVVGFEQGDITIPDDDVLLRELQAFSCIYNHSTGAVKYSAPNGLHDDCVISLAYAYSLVKTKKGVYNVR